MMSVWLDLAISIIVLHCSFIRSFLSLIKCSNDPSKLKNVQKIFLIDLFNQEKVSLMSFIKSVRAKTGSSTTATQTYNN